MTNEFRNYEKIYTKCVKEKTAKNHSGSKKVASNDIIHKTAWEIWNSIEAEGRKRGEMQLLPAVSSTWNRIVTQIVRLKLNLVKRSIYDNGLWKKLSSHWFRTGTSPEGPDLQIGVPENKKDQFLSLLEERAIKTLNKGVEIQTDAKLKTGFSIGPKDGSYFIRFSGDDFENYFKGYFKEKTRKLLFGEDEK